MAELTRTCYINFNYKSPHEDMTKCISYNNNGSVNVGMTLNNYKRMMEDNLEVVEKLITHSKDIDNVMVSGYDLVNIGFKSRVVCDNLLKEGIIKEHNESGSESDDELTMSSDEETNIQRLRGLENITGHQLTNSEDNSTTDEEGEMSDDNNPVMDMEKLDRLLTSLSRTYIEDN